MTRQRALRLAREWAQGHKCTLRDGEAAEYHSIFAAMLEESMPNEPLTLDELRKMDGQPAWGKSLITNKPGEWFIVRVVEMSKAWFIASAGAEQGFGDKDTYGKTWLAYRRPPEGEEET